MPLILGGPRSLPATIIAITVANSVCLKIRLARYYMYISTKSNLTIYHVRCVDGVIHNSTLLRQVQ